MRRRGESGQMEIAGGILVLGILLGIFLAPAALHDLADASNAFRKEEEAAAKARAEIPKIDLLAPPSGKVVYDCVVEAFKAHKLKWEDSTWKSEQHPKPKLTGDLATDRGAIAAWKYDIENYIKQFEFEWEACNKPPLAAPKVDPLPPPPAANLRGIYTVSETGNTCRLGGLATLNVTDATAGGGRASVSIVVGTSVALSGSMDAEGHLDVRGQTVVNQGDERLEDTITAHLTGVLGQFGETATLRSGLLELSSSKDADSCTIAFSASRG